MKVANRVLSSTLIAITGAIVIAGAIHFAHAQDQAANVAQRAPMASFALSPTPPQGAVILFSGKASQLSDNFYKRYSKNAGDWTADDNGASSPKGDDLTSRMEFGDSFVHAEFQASVDANGKAVGEGNSGIGFQGRYEVQILDSYNHRVNAGDCGALYSQKAPLVNPSKKPGEWQTFDIVFRAPRFDAGGTVIEKARATVFFNGVLVQNNEEFNGPTGIQYGEFKGQAKSGPIILQGDHSPVHFRNVWAVPL